MKFSDLVMNKLGAMVIILLLSSSCGYGTSTPASASVKADEQTAEVLRYELDTSGLTIEKRYPSPRDFARQPVEKNSFSYYLRNLPLKPHGSPVLLYNGSRKRSQAAASSVVDLDVGTRDLQQCADAVMRLRAEYLWNIKDYNAIKFHFTNGFLAEYSKWRAGNRIKVSGNDVGWTASRAASTSYTSFRSYLNMVFAYAGTLSLEKEMGVKSVADIAIGDVFIQGGSPGHAVIVVDMVENTSTGTKMILLAQSYMPAQDIHVLNNPNADLPWYNVEELAGQFITPEWRFSGNDLRHF